MADNVGRLDGLERGLPGRYRVMDCIRRNDAISRVEIADRSGLGRSTVTSLTKSLLDDGWIRETEGISNEPARGRPRVMLEMNADAANVLGVKLSLHQMSVAVTDFKGDVVHTTALPFNGHQPPDLAADLIEVGVRRCLNEAGLSAAGVLGLCVALPGYVSHEDGRCYWSPAFDRDNVDFGALLAGRFDFDTSIENDANMVTLAEHWFGEGRNLSSFAVVTVEHGIGMGLITNDRLYRGGAGIGPEFGHSKAVFGGRPCRCGQLGCVEAYASEYAIVREVLPRFSLEGYVTDPRTYHAEIERITREALAGNEKLRAEFEAAGRTLGQALGNLVATINPPTIIVTGEGLRAGTMMFEPMIDEIHKLALPGNPFETEVILHEWGDDVWARGAAAMVLSQAYSAAPERIADQARRSSEISQRRRA